MTIGVGVAPIAHATLRAPVKWPERFTASAVKRAVLLKQGDDPAIGPGQLMVRVFVEAADDEGLAGWQRAHQAGIEEFRRELSLRLPSARLLEFGAAGFVCSVDHARAALGFTAALTLPAGLEQTVRWYRDRGWV